MSMVEELNNEFYYSKMLKITKVPKEYFDFIPNQEISEEAAERMYSEEDMIEFAKWVFLEVGSNTGKDRTNKELFKEWFEQFKKK